jgi:hypothetical protein
MSRWSAAFDAIRARDTVDTISAPSGTQPHSGNSVHSVSGGKGGDGATAAPIVSTVSTVSAGERCGEAAPEQDGAHDDAPAMPIMRLPVIPPDEHAEMLAEAMFANRETAMRYLRPIARTRLSATEDQYARGLMIGWERHRMKGQPDD